MVVSGVEEAFEDEGFDHGAHGDLADEHAVSVAYFDDVEGDEGADGLADGGAGYSQVGAQLGLRRQRITRMQVLGENVVLNLGNCRG